MLPTTREQQKSARKQTNEPEVSPEKSKREARHGRAPLVAWEQQHFFSRNAREAQIVPERAHNQRGTSLCPIRFLSTAIADGDRGNESPPYDVCSSEELQCDRDVTMAPDVKEKDMNMQRTIRHGLLAVFCLLISSLFAACGSQSAGSPQISQAVAPTVALHDPSPGQLE